MDYEVLHELEIPTDAFLEPIPSEVLELVRNKPGTPRDLHLAQIAIRGHDIDTGRWQIGAYSPNSADTPPSFDDAYGAVEVMLDSDTTPRWLLKVAEQWVRDSGVWAPWPIEESRADEEGIEGIILARSSRLIRQHQQSQQLKAERAGTARWSTKFFVQEMEQKGKSEIKRAPTTPIGTPMGVSHVPLGPDYISATYGAVGPSPAEQFAEFLNEHGDAIKDWEIVDKGDSLSWLLVLYKMEVEE